MPWISPEDMGYLASHYSQENKVRICDFVNKLVELAVDETKSKEEVRNTTIKMIEALVGGANGMDSEMKADMLEDSKELFGRINRPS